MPERTWIEIRIEVPDRLQEEAALYLTEWSGRGVVLEDDSLQVESTGLVGIKVYFPAEEYGPVQQAELQQYLQRLESLGYRLGRLLIRNVREEDWAEAWKAHFKPVKLTRRIVIRPPWGRYLPQPSEIVITVYPGMAFGTGRHPTTRLCLQALEEMLAERPDPARPEPWTALDVGTGTGILALAAARFGAQVLAIDIDPEALAAARKNILLNQLEERIRAEDLPLATIRQQFDLILANLTALDLRSLAEPLAGRLQPGGRLIASGILQDEVSPLLAAFQNQGLQMTRTYTGEDWVALVFGRF